MRYVMFLLGGVVLTYIYNFIRYFNPGDPGHDFGSYMANALYEGLLTTLSILFQIVTTLGVSLGAVFLFLFVYDKRKNKTVAILAEAKQKKQAILKAATQEKEQLLAATQKEREEILGKAQEERWFTQRETEKIASLKAKQTTAYDAACIELEQKRQCYLAEITGLKGKLEYKDLLIEKLAKELDKIRRKGIAKLREQGNEGGARRSEKELAKLMDAATSVSLPTPSSAKITVNGKFLKE